MVAVNTNTHGITGLREMSAPTDKCKALVFSLDCKAYPHGRYNHRFSLFFEDRLAAYNCIRSMRDKLSELVKEMDAASSAEANAAMKEAYEEGML